MRLPFNGRNRMTSPYGTRVLNGAACWHAGIDLVGDDNTTVHSVCAGTVYSSTMVAKSSGDLTWQWGNYVCIKGDDGRYYYYCHLASRAVAKGARVQEGDVLGVMGNTGYSFGAHTHFEVRKSDRRTTVSAADVLGIKNVCGTYTQTEQRMITANALHVRRAPDTRYGSNGLLQQGVTVTPIETENGWAYIRTDALAGWISLAYTKAV